MKTLSFALFGTCFLASLPALAQDLRIGLGGTLP